AQPTEQLGGRVRARLAEDLARDDLEQIAARERLARHPDHSRVLAGRVITPVRHAAGPDVRHRAPGPWQARGRAAGDLEIVAPHRRQLALVVDDHELVRKIEQEVALIGGSLEPEPDRLPTGNGGVTPRTAEGPRGG